MNWKSQPSFRDHVRGKLPDISYFTVFLSWLAFKHFKTVGKRWGILERGLLHVITRSIGEMMYETSFTKLHSQKKEMQLSNFLKGWIFVVLQVLKLLSIAREPWTILEQVFYTLLPRALAKWNTLQSSSIYTLLKKKRNFPCCVSFETECKATKACPET